MDAWIKFIESFCFFSFLFINFFHDTLQKWVRS